MRRRTAGTAVTLLAAGAVLAACFPTTTAELPNTAQIEPYDMAGNDLRGTGRAIMLRVDHVPDPQYPRKISIEKTRVYVREGDVGPIKVTTYDTEREEIDSWYAPHPGEGGQETASGVEARYGVPYSDDLTEVTIVDTRTGEGTRVRLDEVIRDYCTADPTDSICRDIDLQTHVSLDDYGLRTLAVGEALTVPVTFSVVNAGSDWARPSGYTSVYGILDGVTFTTTEPSLIDAGVLDPTQSLTVRIDYTLTCVVDGDHRVFVGAEFNDSAREAVDANPSDNRWNTYFDVKCTPMP